MLRSKCFSLPSFVAALLLVFVLAGTAGAQDSAGIPQPQESLLVGVSSGAVSGSSPESQLADRLQTAPGGCRPFCSDMLEEHFAQLRETVNQQLERANTPVWERVWTIYLGVLDFLQRDLIMLANVADVFTLVALAIMLFKKRLHQWRRRVFTRPRGAVRTHSSAGVTSKDPEAPTTPNPRDSSKAVDPSLRDRTSEPGETAVPEGTTSGATISPSGPDSSDALIPGAPEGHSSQVRIWLVRAEDMERLTTGNPVQDGQGNQTASGQPGCPGTTVVVCTPVTSVRDAPGWVERPPGIKPADASVDCVQPGETRDQPDRPTRGSRQPSDAGKADDGQPSKKKRKRLRKNKKDRCQSKLKSGKHRGRSDRG